MRFSTQREVILDPLQKIVGVVERRQTKPILGHVLVDTIPQGLRFTATDLEIELDVEVEVEETEEGRVTVPARKFYDIVKALPSDAAVQFAVEGQKALIRSGRGRFSLATLPPEDFPRLTGEARQVAFDLRLSGLMDLLRHTAFAMAQQDVRYYLNGLLLEISDGILRTVATDGHRLALYELEGTVEVEGNHQVILPRKGVQELMRFEGQEDTTVSVGLAGNHVFVQFPRAHFVSKLIDGRYPGYDRVIPGDVDKLLVVDRDALRQSLLRTSILSNEKYRGVRLVMNSSVLSLKADNPEHEEAEEEIEAEFDGGEPLEIGFNVNYLLDVLAVLEGDQVRVSLKDGNSSALIQSGASGKGRYVVMPMRL